MSVSEWKELMLELFPDKKFRDALYTAKQQGIIKPEEYATVLRYDDEEILERIRNHQPVQDKRPVVQDFPLSVLRACVDPFACRQWKDMTYDEIDYNIDDYPDELRAKARQYLHKCGYYNDVAHSDYLDYDHPLDVPE